MAVEGENPYHYSGLHAFGFVLGKGIRPNEVVARMRELGAPPDGPVIWAGSFAGDYSAMAHVRVEHGALGSLQDLIEGDFWDAGLRGRWAIEARAAERTINGSAQRVGVKRATQEIIAISAVRVAPGSLDSVLEQVPEISAFRGASVVYGEADVLLQLGADKFADVAASVETEVQAVHGIVHTSTAFCDGRR